MTKTTKAKPSKDDHRIRLSSHFTEIAETLAATQNTAFAEILTKACERGLTGMVEDYERWLSVKESIGSIEN